MLKEDFKNPINELIKDLEIHVKKIILTITNGGDIKNI